MRSLTFLLLAGSLSAIPAFAQEVSGQQLAKLIKDLGSPECKVRDTASFELRAMLPEKSEELLPFLREAAHSSDAEVRRRAEDPLRIAEDELTIFRAKKFSYSSGAKPKSLRTVMSELSKLVNFDIVAVNKNFDDTLLTFTIKDRTMWEIVDELCRTSKKQFSIVELHSCRNVVAIGNSRPEGEIYRFFGPLALRIGPIEHLAPPDFKIRLHFRLYGDGNTKIDHHNAFAFVSATNDRGGRVETLLDPNGYEQIASMLEFYPTLMPIKQFHNLKVRVTATVLGAPTERRFTEFANGPHGLTATSGDMKITMWPSLFGRGWQCTHFDLREGYKDVAGMPLYSLVGTATGRETDPVTGFCYHIYDPESYRFQGIRSTLIPLEPYKEIRMRYYTRAAARTLSFDLGTIDIPPPVRIPEPSAIDSMPLIIESSRP